MQSSLLTMHVMHKDFFFFYCSYFRIKTHTKNAFAFNHILQHYLWIFRTLILFLILLFMVVIIFVKNRKVTFSNRNNLN